ncbi:MAG: TonB family protein [Candidatus Margulisiibacteriota bacterium]
MSNFKLGLVTSIALHLLLFGVLSISQVTPPKFGVKASTVNAPVSVALVGPAPTNPSARIVPKTVQKRTPTPPEQPKPKPVTEPKSETIPLKTEAVVPQPPSKPQVETPAASETPRQPQPRPAATTPVETTTAHAPPASEGTGTAIVPAEPSYLENPAPSYPAAARRRGLEGLVLLQVDVNTSGRATSVSLKKSSGHGILDEAAIRAVKTWIFKPAMRGRTPIDCTVDVPIRFQLED